jgi:hypothetical protein
MDHWCTTGHAEVISALIERLSDIDTMLIGCLFLLPLKNQVWFARPAPAAATGPSAETGKDVCEFTIDTMLLNGGKRQLYGVGAVFILDGHARRGNRDDGAVPKHDRVRQGFTTLECSQKEDLVMYSVYDEDVESCIPGRWGKLNKGYR